MHEAIDPTSPPHPWNPAAAIEDGEMHVFDVHSGTGPHVVSYGEGR